MRAEPGTAFALWHGDRPASPVQPSHRHRGTRPQRGPATLRAAARDGQQYEQSRCAAIWRRICPGSGAKLPLLATRSAMGAEAVAGTRNGAESEWAVWVPYKPAQTQNATRSHVFAQ